MIGRRTLQLVALFVVLSVVGMGYVGLRYVGAGALVGLGPTTVDAQFRDYGGIFPDASVSYRGVEVGKTGTMRVTPTGVSVELLIDHGAPDIPASSFAVVANRSAVGEQYVDLQPPADGGPVLEDGSVIPPERTRTPVQVDALLGNLNSLVTSVPLPELRQTVDELDNAFNRSGPELQRLIDASNPLVRDAIRNLPQTTQLLRDGRVVLGTQAQVGGQFISFSRDLAVFSDQLKRDDPNLRRLVTAAPAAATQLEGLIRETGPDLTRTLDNLLVIANIAEPRLAGVEQLLVTYPVIAAAAPSVVPGDGFAHLGVVTNVNDPPPCRAGYIPLAENRPATITSNDKELDTSIRCAESPPVNVRGSQNDPALSGAAGGAGTIDGSGGRVSSGGGSGTAATPASSTPTATPTSMDVVPADTASTGRMGFLPGVTP